MGGLLLGRDSDGQEGNSTTTDRLTRVEGASFRANVDPTAGAPFDVGQARPEIIATVREGHKVVDVQEWQREVEIVRRPGDWRRRTRGGPVQRGWRAGIGQR